MNKKEFDKIMLDTWKEWREEGFSMEDINNMTDRLYKKIGFKKK